MPFRDATMDQVSERARALLQGAIDTHVHASPDPYTERRLDSHALVSRARDAGMAGLVLKSHEYPTQPLAWLLDREFPEVDVYGSIALDHAVGGLNMEAVSVSLSIGARVVWMPTFDAAQWRAFRPDSRHAPGPGITVLDDSGELRHSCHAILDLIAQHDAVLATGHLSTPETLALAREARRRHVRTVVTHASFWIEPEAQRELASLGVYIEQVAMGTLGPDGDVQEARIFEQVRDVGPEHVVLATDLGQAQNPEPVVGFGLWIDRFLETGFSEAELATMVRDNPRALLGSP